MGWVPDHPNHRVPFDNTPQSELLRSGTSALVAAGPSIGDCLVEPIAEARPPSREVSSQRYSDIVVT